MNNDEGATERYLRSLDIGEVVHEPDGKIPPDFLVGGRIAVEVRRLNQYYDAGDGKLRGLEQDSISLRQSLEKLLLEFVDSAPATSWFVTFKFRRPYPEWRTLRPIVRNALSRFLETPRDEASRIPITDSFHLTIIRAKEARRRRFILGGHTDMDAGGWIVSEVVRNVSAFMSAKSLKVAPYLDRYPAWWLVFVDHIALGSEATDVREHISRTRPWDRVVIVDPSGEHSYQI